MRIQFKFTFLLFIFSLFLVNAFGQKELAQPANVESTNAVYLGKTSAVRDLIPLGPSPKSKKQEWKKQNKIPKNFIGRGENKVVKRELEHQGPDKLRQGILMGSKSTDANLIVNINGLTNGSPNDPSGDIGKNHYVQAINATMIAVYDKSGTELATFSANTLWQEIGFSSAGDPIVVYDEIEDRWIITEFPNGNQLLVAISESDDPMGAYDVYNFQTPNFPDYPKYGIWKDAITVTTNEQGGGNLTVYLINKSQLYGAKDLVDIQRIVLPGNTNTESGFYVATPVDWMGKNEPASEDPIFLALNDSSWGDVDEDQISIFTIDVDWLDPDNTSFVNKPVVTSPYDSNPCSVAGPGFSCVPQGGSGGGLDGIPEVIMNQAVYRNFGEYETMVFNFITDVSDGDNLSGIRWIEMRKTFDTEWTIYQEGTFSPDDGLDRYMAGIAIDASGNIGMAYNVSSEEEFVGVRFTGRKYDDELGMMTVPEQEIIAGTNTIQSGARFGDYAQMGVDPINGKTFWYTTEYGGAGGNNSHSRIASFELDRDQQDIAVHKMISETVSGAFDLDEKITVQINNFGLEAVSDFSVGYMFNGGDPVIELVTETINSGESLEYTFVEGIDFDDAGIYPFISFTSYELDELVLNDTMWTNFNKLTQYDLAASRLDIGPPISCDSVLNGQLEMFNFGSMTITTAKIEVFLDGMLELTDTWDGSLAFCESGTYDFMLTDLSSGDHTIEVVISEPNGEQDDNSDNNSKSKAVEVITDGILSTLTLTTDFFPEETTWELVDEDGNVIVIGGPYEENNTVHEELICLKDEACYTFTIFDSYSDGINFPGGYTIVNQNGSVLASLMSNNFGDLEQNEFCATGGCALNVDVSVTPAGTDGGSILITPSNGAGPFMYSIDGGDTFQDANLFENVPAGDYVIVVTGAGDCLYEGSITVENCAIQVMAEIDNETDMSKGAIYINASGGNAPYEYSNNGGATWQDDPLFNILVAGMYEIVVRDADGCEFTETVEIKFMVATTSFQIGTILRATPNPTLGDFKIYLEGATLGSTFIKFVIYNSEGKAIRHHTLVKYDDYYTAQVSLHHEPAGIYYLRVNDGKINKMLKIVKL